MSNDSFEHDAPWVLPAGVEAQKLTSLHKIEAAAGQSVIRVPSLGSMGAMMDMNAFDPSGSFVFIPHETRFGGGVTRYDIDADRAITLFRGDNGGARGDWSKDYGSLDAATWTPANTLLIAEEWSGQGRVFEISNPLADIEDGEVVKLIELSAIPNVAHEGLRFNHGGTALYFIDEFLSGSIYKFIPMSQNDYRRGQTFVLVVDDYSGDADRAWNDAANRDTVRTGLATWVPLTHASGGQLTKADPFDNQHRGGRSAADELHATPFGRPEDVEVVYLANGHEALYFTATAEHAIYVVEELGQGKVQVTRSVSLATPRNLDYPQTTATLSAPDNLAQSPDGTIYILEDKPNRDNTGGDIWRLRDVDRDGMAESIDHFMSLRVKGAENTGMIFRPQHPQQFIINVQHPDSTANISDGQGDALWLMDLTGLAD